MLFFTDWGGSPKIESAYMDGSNREVIVSTDLVYPQSITADYIQQRVYWVDTNLDVVESVKYDGSQRVKIFNGNQVGFVIVL